MEHKIFLMSRSTFMLKDPAKMLSKERYEIEAGLATTTYQSAVILFLKLSTRLLFSEVWLRQRVRHVRGLILLDD